MYNKWPAGCRKKCPNKFKIRRKIFFSIINNFKPLPHRGEYLVKKAGVVFINDSKATSFEAAKNSLSIHKNIFWSTKR